MRLTTGQMPLLRLHTAATLLMAYCKDTPLIRPSVSVPASHSLRLPPGDVDSKKKFAQVEGNLNLPRGGFRETTKFGHRKQCSA